MAAAVLAMIIAIVPMVLILAAQLHGLATTGNWRGFQVSELLDVLQIDVSTMPADSQLIVGLLRVPAALLLFLVTSALYLFAVVLHRLNRRERRRLNNMQQNALIKEIDRVLEVIRKA